jgi:molecular chaperone GrpE (heat shock protein)
MCYGYIAIHRKLREHWLYEEKRVFSKFEAWIDILYDVNHQDNKFLLGSELVEVKRGSVITSLRKLSERWSWSITKVNSFLELLEQDKMLVVKKDTKKTRLTVVNYDFYQSDKWKKEHESNTEKTPEEHEKDTKVTRKETNKNDKNELIMNDNEKKQNKQKEEEKKEEKEKEKICYESIKEYWNNKNSLPAIRNISTKRKEKIKSRILENTTVEFYKAIDKLASSDFATGKTKDKEGKSWIVTIDWLIDNDTNIIKVLEGKYDNKEKFSSNTEKGAYLNKEVRMF